MKGLFPIKLMDGEQVCLRDGLVFVLFINKSHAEIAENAGQLFDKYIDTIGEDTLNYIHDRGEFFRPMTKKILNRARKLLSSEGAKKRKDEFFTLISANHPSEAGNHLFQYSAEDLSQLDPEETSYIEIWFPTEYVEQIGHEIFVQLILAMASLVPFTSGYCSLAFNHPDWARTAAENYIRKIAFRYPGIDIHLTQSTAMVIGNSVRGAYWLTLLGPEPLSELGANIDDIKAELGDEIRVLEINKSIAIQAGDKPLSGDINSKDNLPLIRKVAKLIEPIMLIQDSGIFGFDEVEKFVEWQKRHLL